jgi:cytochrome oxidase assembly protein ShyY1
VQQQPKSASQTWSRLRFLATPRWIALEIAVIAFTLACYFLLAPWQFSRSTEHDAQMAEVAAAVSAAPADVAELLSTSHQPGVGTQWRLATATGHFDAAKQSYIRLRQDNDGQPAYEVVVPFVTASGAVLVDRGYVPYQAVQESSLELPALPTGTVTIAGRVQPDQTDPRDRPPVTVPDGHTAYTAAASGIVDAIPELAGQPVYRGFLQLTEDSPGVIDAIALPQGDNSRPFFSYAIQWLSFGAIAVLGFGYFVYREFHDPVDGDIYLSGPPPDDEGEDESGTGYDAAPAPAARTPGLAISSDGAAANDGAPTNSRKRAKFDKSRLYDA